MQPRLHIFVVDECINVLFYGSRVPLKSYCCTHYIFISPLTAFFTLSCSVSHPASWRIPGVFIVVLFSAMCFINNAVRYYGLSRDAGSRRGKLKPFFLTVQVGMSLPCPLSYLICCYLSCAPLHGQERLIGR